MEIEPDLYIVRKHASVDRDPLVGVSRPARKVGSNACLVPERNR